MANHLYDLVRLYATDPGKTFIETDNGTVFTYDDLFARRAASPMRWWPAA